MDSISEITDLTTLVENVSEINDQFKGQIWWRGQRDFSWPLTPSIKRHPDNSRSEQNLVARFKHKAPSRHPSVPPSNDFPSWLFLMQHYRLPTRLLDWTESPLAALFFATEIDPGAESYPNKIDDSDGALFALSPYKLNQNQTQSHVLFLPTDPPAEKIINPAFDRNTQDPNTVLAIRPSEVDLRLMVQLSVFTLHGSGKLIEDINGHENFLVKYKIPSEKKSQIRSQLKQLGVRASALFPDLEHLAQDISSTRFREKLSFQKSLGFKGQNNSFYGESST